MHFRKSLRTSPSPGASFFELLEQRVLLTTYYISESLGNDNNSGTSMSAPWRTLAKLEEITFENNDRVELRGDETYEGHIKKEVFENLQGITLTSWAGTGRAIIESGNTTAIRLKNVSNFEVCDIDLVGPGAQTTWVSGGPNGIFITQEVGSHDDITIRNMDIAFYDKKGIELQVWGGARTNGVVIDEVTVHDGGDMGIFLVGPTEGVTDPIIDYRLKNVSVTNSRVWNQRGHIGAQNTTDGGGIYLGQVQHGLISHNVVYNTGELNNNSSNGGPAGIWTARSSRIVIQYNVSHSNKTGSGVDGAGFDLDNNTRESVMQYNYSYNNHGAGFLIYNGTGQQNNHSNNIVRYNISENDSRFGTQAGMEIAGEMSKLYVYGNSVYITPTLDGKLPSALSMSPQSDSYSVYVWNNIFQATNANQPAIKAYNLGQKANVRFQGNLYYNGSTQPIFADAVKEEDSLQKRRSLTEFQAVFNLSGQPMEKLNSTTLLGLQADPKFIAPGTGLAIDYADLRPALRGYRLQTSSPAINSGKTYGVEGFAVDTALTDSRPGTVNPDPLFPTSATLNNFHDYYGSYPKIDGNYDMGAFESLPNAGTVITLGSPSYTSNYGWANYSNATGQYTFESAGAGVSGTIDQGTFAYRSLSGDQTLVAKLDSQDNTSDNARAGLMIREYSVPGSRMAYVTISPNGKIRFYTRATPDTAVTTVKTVTSPTAKWIRLVRSGNNFTASFSIDNVIWKPLGTTTSIAMSTNVLGGMSVTSGVAGTSGTAVFSGFAVTAGGSAAASSSTSSGLEPAQYRPAKLMFCGYGALLHDLSRRPGVTVLSLSVAIGAGDTRGVVQNIVPILVIVCQSASSSNT